MALIDSYGAGGSGVKSRAGGLVDSYAGYTPPAPKAVAPLNDRLSKWKDLYSSATPDVQATLQQHIEARYKANPKDLNAKAQYDALFGANKALLKSGAKPEQLPTQSHIGPIGFDPSMKNTKSVAKGLGTFAINATEGNGIAKQSVGYKDAKNPNSEAKLINQAGNKFVSKSGKVNSATVGVPSKLNTKGDEVGKAASVGDVAKNGLMAALLKGSGGLEGGAATAVNVGNKALFAKTGYDQAKQIPETLKMLKDPNISTDKKIQASTQMLAALGLTLVGAHGAIKEGVHGANTVLDNIKAKAEGSGGSTAAKLGTMNKVVDATMLPEGRGPKVEQLNGSSTPKPLALPGRTATNELPSGGHTTPGGATTVKTEPTINNGPETKPLNKTESRVGTIDKKLNDFKTNPHTTMTPNEAKALQQERYKLVNQPVMDHIAQTHANETSVPESTHPVTGETIPAQTKTTAQAHAEVAAGKSEYSGLYKAAKEDKLSSEHGGISVSHIPLVGDVAHAVKQAAASARAFMDIVHPKISSAAKDIFYGARGSADLAQHQATKQLADAHKYFNGADLTTRKNFVQAIMTGQEDKLSPVEQKHAATIKEMLNSQLQAEQEHLKTASKDHYFPTSGIWDKAPDAGKAFAMTGKTIGGNKSFLKDKVWENLMQGEAAGGKVRADFNPVELVTKRIYEGTKALELSKHLEEAQKQGLAYSPATIKGMNATDRAAALSGKVQSTDSSLKGWWIHPDLAKMVERHNSSNWFTENDLGRGISAAKNSGTALKLALSAAHATQSTMIRIADQFGLGLEKILAPRGSISGKMRLSGIGDIATSTVAPVLDVLKHLSNNDAALKDFFGGGGKLGQDAQYKQAFGSAKQALAEGQYLRAGGKAIFGANQALLKPLFERYIPDMKVSSVAQRTAFEMQKNARAIAEGKMSVGEILRKNVKQADQSFGEMNYDNLHWNNTVKGAAQFATRALGWTYGNMAQLGKGVIKAPIDLIKAPVGLVTGKGGGISPESAKLAGLLVTVGTAGAAYQLLHTGKMPQTAQDFYEPKNGQKDANGKDVRVQFLNPLNDALSLRRNVQNYGVVPGVGKFFSGKEADTLSNALALLNNKDYLGNYVYDPKAGWVQKAQEAGGFLGKSALPISLTNATNKTSNVSPLGGFFGVTKASSLDSRSKLETEISNGLNDKFGNKAKTPKEVAAAQVKTLALQDIRNGKPNSSNVDAYKKVASPEDFKKLTQKGGKTSVQSNFELLNNDQKLTIIDKLGQKDIQPLKGEATKNLLKDMFDRKSIDSLHAKGFTDDKLRALLSKLGYSEADATQAKREASATASAQAKLSRHQPRFVGPFGAAPRGRRR